MFYDTSTLRPPLEGTRDDREHAVVVLTPSESKRLIARGILRLPEISRVLETGLLIVSRGTTTSFIAEELLGTILPKAYCTAGVITSGRMGITLEDRRLGPWVFRNGKLVDEPAEEVLKEFTATDVSLKSANAIDPQGNAGILVSNEVAGTIGSIWPTLSARGSYLIAPVGLEKLIPSVIAASFACGTRVFSHFMGASVGLVPIVAALAVTEVQALEALTGVTAIHVASGGIGGAEGAVILAVEGRDDAVRNAFELVDGIKGEPPLLAPDLEPGTGTP